MEHSEPPEAAEHDTKDDQTKTGKDVKKSSDKKRAELSPFLHTSAYLLDVHAAKVCGQLKTCLHVYFFHIILTVC